MLRTDPKLSIDHIATPDLRGTDFSFLPSPLVAKCKDFIESHHDLHGYKSLTAILWDPELRGFLEINDCLRRAFKKATSSRSAKKTNQSLTLIATAILTLEIMATGFAGWAQRYPRAHRIASALLFSYVHGSKTRLMDKYLYPRAFMVPAALIALSPAENAEKRLAEIREAETERRAEELDTALLA